MLNLSPAEIKGAAQNRLKSIFELAETVGRPLRFMEVCGTHTVAIFKAGLRQLLPESIELVSGPGCPVCVTSSDYMDQAITYAKEKDVIIATFGDMLKVPGSIGSLAKAKAQGADIRIIYSPLDSLDLAQEHPDKKVIFLAVGFETTTPTAAAAVLEAQRRQIPNWYLLNAHKLVPPVMKALLQKQSGKIDGFLLPGHVCAIIGTKDFAFLPKQNLPSVVAGFEGLDLVESIYQLMNQVVTGHFEVYNEYNRVVKTAGNVTAQKMVDEVYEPCSTTWRGLGLVPESGLKLRERYSCYDAELLLTFKPIVNQVPTACRCGDVLQGLIKPTECPLFAKACRPEQPVGACMVSVEGACAAWHKYGAGRWQGK